MSSLSSQTLPLQIIAAVGISWLLHVWLLAPLANSCFCLVKPWPAKHFSCSSRSGTLVPCHHLSAMLSFSQIASGSLLYAANVCDETTHLKPIWSYSVFKGLKLLMKRRIKLKKRQTLRILSRLSTDIHVSDILPDQGDKTFHIVVDATKQLTGSRAPDANVLDPEWHS